MPMRWWRTSWELHVVSRTSQATGNPNIQKEGMTKKTQDGGDEVVMKENRNDDATRSSAPRGQRVVVQREVGGSGGWNWTSIQVTWLGVSGPGPVFRDYRNTKGGRSDVKRSVAKSSSFWEHASANPGPPSPLIIRAFLYTVRRRRSVLLDVAVAESPPGAPKQAYVRVLSW